MDRDGLLDLLRIRYRAGQMPACSGGRARSETAQRNFHGFGFRIRDSGGRADEQSERQSRITPGWKA